MTPKHLRGGLGFVSSPHTPSPLLSVCLHSSTFNLLLFLSCYVPSIPVLHPRPFGAHFFLPVQIFARNAATVALRPPVLLTSTPSATRAGSRQTLAPPRAPLLLPSPRQGVLAWLYPREQQPGLRPARQIG